MQAVHEETEGNPFFVSEIVSLLASEGRLDSEADLRDVMLTIPQGVREVVGRRLDRLSDERAELYGRCGYLQGQLAAAQEQIRALEAPRAAAAEGTARRRWWRFLGAS